MEGTDRGVIPRAVSNAAFSRMGRAPRTGEDGTLSLSFLPEGSYTLLLEARGQLVLWGDFSLPGPATVSMTGPKKGDPASR